MRLTPDEKHCLEALYLHHAVPTDQLRRMPSVLDRITAAFHRLTDRDESAAELLRYMINRRKNKDWPRLGERAQPFSPALHELLDGELDILVDIYRTIDVPLDEYLLRPDLAKNLAATFASHTHRLVKKSVLVAALMAHRKRGLLPCLCEADRARVFDDIDAVAREDRHAG